MSRLQERHTDLARLVFLIARRLSGTGVAGQEQAPLWRVAEDAQRLETGEERSFSLQENASRKRSSRGLIRYVCSFPTHILSWVMMFLPARLRLVSRGWTSR
jgi:hypothetical protein